MLVRQTESLAGGIDKFRAGLTVGFIGPCDFGNPLPDQSMGNDQLWFAIVVVLCALQRIEKRLHVLPVDFLNIEPVGSEPHRGVFALTRRGRSVEGDGIRVVNQNQIIQAEMAGECACLRCYAFLHATVARKADTVLIENAVFRSIESLRRHFHRHRDADGIADSLPKWAGCAFDSRRFEKLRMPGRFGMQLPEPFDLRHRQVVAAQVQPCVEEHRTVAGRQNEIVAANPSRLIRIIF